MKRKYAAMMLGLMLTVSSMNVYAADTSNAEDTTTQAAADESAGQEETEVQPEAEAREDVYGEVTSVGEDSITIAVGTLKEQNDVPVTDEADLDDTQSEDSEGDTQATDTDAQTEDSGTDTQADADLESDAAGEIDIDNADPMNRSVEIELTGEEATIEVTENTILLREIKDETMQEGSYEMKEDPSAEESDASEPEEAADDIQDSDQTESDEVQLEVDENGAVADDMMADVSSADPGLMNEDVLTEAITLEDIQEGDVVTISFDDEGNAAAITVLFAQSDEEASPEENPELKEDKQDLQSSDEADTAEEADTTEADTEGTDTTQEEGTEQAEE